MALVPANRRSLVLPAVGNTAYALGRLLQPYLPSWSDAWRYAQGASSAPADTQMPVRRSTYRRYTRKIRRPRRSTRGTRPRYSRKKRKNLRKLASRIPRIRQSAATLFRFKLYSLQNVVTFTAGNTTYGNTLTDFMPSWSGTSVTLGIAYLLTFNIASLAGTSGDYTSFANRFDYVRLCGIKVILRPTMVNVTLDGTLTTPLDFTKFPSKDPAVTTVEYDPTSNINVTASDALSVLGDFTDQVARKERYRRHKFGRPIVRYFKPMINECGTVINSNSSPGFSSDVGSITTALNNARRKPSPYFSFNNPNATHFGMLIAFPYNGASTSASTGDNPKINYSIEVWYYCAFRSAI